MSKQLSIIDSTFNKNNPPLYNFFSVYNTILFSAVFFFNEYCVLSLPQSRKTKQLLRFDVVTLWYLHVYQFVAILIVRIFIRVLIEWAIGLTYLYGWIMADNYIIFISRTLKTSTCERLLCCGFHARSRLWSIQCDCNYCHHLREWYHPWDTGMHACYDY